MKKKKQVLLPHKFKYLSFVIGGIILLIPLLLKLIGVNLGEHFHYTSILKITAVVVTFLFILSRDRIEDERTMTIRLKAYASAMIFGMIFFVIHTIRGFFDGEEVRAFDIIVMMFGGYFISFYSLKRNS